MGMEVKLKERNRQIGAILRQARLRQKCTVAECAALIRTSRRRYTAMERGEIAVSIVDMEQLMDYLHIPYMLVSPRVFTTEGRRVVVEEQGEEFIVRVSK